MDWIFSKTMVTPKNGYYLNEDAKRRLELSDDDREMVWGKDETAPISGIIKDFHRINVLHEAEPFAIRLQEHVKNPNFLVKTNGDKQAKTAFDEMLRGLGVAEEELDWYISSLEEGIAETFEDPTEHAENHHTFLPHCHCHLGVGLRGLVALLHPPTAEGDCHPQGDGIDVGRGAAADAPHVLRSHADFVRRRRACLLLYHERLAYELLLSHHAQSLDIRCCRLGLPHHFPAHRRHPEARCFRESREQYQDRIITIKNAYYD